MNASIGSPRRDGIVAPRVRDLGEMTQAIIPWLADRLGQPQDLAIENIAYPQGAGMSHETILLDAVWSAGGDRVRRGLVVRIKPTSMHVYRDDMFEAQFDIMRLMHEEGHIRIAETFWIERDDGILGAPFFVMEKLSGQVPISNPSYAQAGWLHDASPAERRVLWEDSVRQLAGIQKTDVDKAAFLSLDPELSGFDQEVDRWRRYLAWAEERADLPFHHKVLDRLLVDLPQNREAGIVWGDARLGNMMFGEDRRVVAVMDWEQPSLGGALHDLAWWLFSERLRTFAIGLPTLPGMGERAETVDLWEEVSGKSAAGLDWYIHFAMFKMSCLSAKMVLDRAAKGAMPELHATPMNRMLAEALDLEMPAGGR